MNKPNTESDKRFVREMLIQLCNAASPHDAIQAGQALLMMSNDVKPKRVFWRFIGNGALFMLALITTGLFTAIAGRQIERNFEVETSVAEQSADRWLEETRMLPVTNVVVCNGARCTAWVQEVGAMSLECDEKTCVQR